TVESNGANRLTSMLPSSGLLRPVSLRERALFLQIPRQDLACLLICTGAFCLWTIAVAGQLPLSLFALFLGLPISAYYYGGAIARPLGLQTSFCITLTIGSLGCAVLLLCIKAFSSFSLSFAAFIVAAGSVGLVLINTSKSQPAIAKSASREWLA